MSKKILTILLLMVTGTAFAGELDQILKKHYEAMGGESVLKAAKSAKLTGKLIMQSPQGEMEMTTMSLLKDGTKMRSETVMQGMTMTQCVSGDSGWQIVPMMGSTDPQDLTGDELKSMKDRADFRGDLWDWKAKGLKLELMGKEDVEGTEAYKIQITTKDGDVKYHYLDTEYYLPIKMVFKVVQMGQPMEFKAYPSDYKKLENGMMWPFSISMSTAMGELVVTTESVEINIDIPDSAFEKPVKESSESNQ